MTAITVVGGGLAGLVSAISCAEAGRQVRLYEAHHQLGGRARGSQGEFLANFGPHVLYDNSDLWPWLDARGLVSDAAKAQTTGARFRWRGQLRRVPPVAAVRALRALVSRREKAPVDVDLRTWLTSKGGPVVAEAGCNACGVFSFDADPGRLSAAFAQERARKAFVLPPAARYLPGGWNTLVSRLEALARSIGVDISTGTPVEQLPDPPVIVATPLRVARRLLDDPSLSAVGTRTALLDVGLRSRRGDPFLISDLDEACWVERFSARDASLAPAGHSLVQAQGGLRDGETLESGVARLERLLDLGFRGWRHREVWRRRSVIEDSTGAVDLPGSTWRDRPAVDRGNGVFLAGDMVAAPGLLSDCSFNSAIEAARLAGGGGGSPLKPQRAPPTERDAFVVRIPLSRGVESCGAAGCSC